MQKKTTHLHRLKILLILIAVFIILNPFFYLIIYIFFFRPFQMAGDSMNPTFTSEAYILTDLVRRNPDSLERQDIITFRSPTDRDKDFVKRIIGVPGDSLRLQEGKVYVNGAVLDESTYLPHDSYTGQGAFLSEGEEVIVPENAYFVIGDNRSMSSDSREYGFVEKELIIGRVMFCYWNCQ